MNLNLQDPEAKKAVFRLLTDDGTFATVLQTVALAMYGPDIYEVDAMEVILRLEEDFNATVTQENENKLKAILLATATNAFYEDPEAFRGTCETLSNGDPGIEVMDSLTVPEVMWGMYEVELNHGPGDLSPSVEAIVERVTGMEAEDLDETLGDDAYAYVWSYLQEQHRMLSNQLQALGVSPQNIPPVTDPTAISDTEDLVMDKL